MPPVVRTRPTMGRCVYGGSCSPYGMLLRCKAHRDLFLVKSDPAPLGRTAAVVRDRRDVLDRLDVEAGRGQGADGGLASGAGALDLHVDRTDAVLLRELGGVLGRDLGRERRALARSLEADAAGARPRQDVAHRI